VGGGGLYDCWKGAGNWRPPLANHREQNRSGKQREHQISFHPSLLDDLFSTMRRSGFWFLNHRLKSHDVIAAIDVERFSRDSGTGVGRQEHAGRSNFRHLHVAL
jgi:hypothetical protein